MDMRTFIEIFESPEAFICRLRKTAADLAKRWNDSQGGSKRVGQRKNVEKSFKITECRFAYSNNIETTSRIFLNVTSFVATQEMNDYADARIQPSHFRVALKLASNLPPGTARPSDSKFRMTRFGVYLPLRQFEALMLSKEMRQAVTAAKNFLGKDFPAPTTFVMTSAGQTAENEVDNQGEGAEGAGTACAQLDATGMPGDSGDPGKGGGGKAGGSKASKAGMAKNSSSKLPGRSGAESDGEGESGENEKRKLRPGNKKMRFFESPEEQEFAEEEDLADGEYEDEDAELIDIGDEEEAEEEEPAKKKEARKRRKKE